MKKSRFTEEQVAYARQMASERLAATVIMFEQSDEGSLNRRYMQLEGLQTLRDTVRTRLSALAR